LHTLQGVVAFGIVTFFEMEMSQVVEDKAPQNGVNTVIGGETACDGERKIVALGYPAGRNGPLISVQ
jgi:hypothetical protein